MHARDAVRTLDVEPVGGNQEVVVRDDAHEPVQQAVPFLGEPGLDQQVRLHVKGHRIADEQERDQRREAVRLGPEPAPVHLEVLVREDRLGGCVKPPRDPRSCKPRRREQLPQPCRGLGRGRGGRRDQILTFFDWSQPACVAGCRDPSDFCAK